MLREFKPTTLILGCGYTLTRLLKRLHTSSVVYTTRTSESLAQAKDFVSTRYHGVALDLNSLSGVRDLFDEFPEIDTVIDSIPPRASSAGGDMLAGVKNICEVISNKKLKRFIYLSTTGVYGINDGSEVDESTPCNPTNSKSKARLDSEAAYSKACENFTAFRISAIYGPGRGLGTSLKNGTYREIQGSEQRWSNRIHVEDLVSALLLSIKFTGILPKKLCISDDKPAPIKEVVDYYCKTFNLPRPPVISQEEALKAEASTQMSSQKIINKLMKNDLALKLKYPSYVQGAATEFE
jgi:nucleoside-diphosphate-sugar epimerase